MEHLWTYTSIILAIVVLAKLLATKTNSVDVLWLIFFGAVGVNIGINSDTCTVPPQSNHL